VQFETARAAEVFEAYVRRQDTCVAGSAFCVPFITLYASDKQLSANAQINDAVAACDLDHNGFLTEAEVFAYCGKSTASEGGPNLPSAAGAVAVPAAPPPPAKP
jgi:hypothetical protein